MQSGASLRGKPRAERWPRGQGKQAKLEAQVRLGSLQGQKRASQIAMWAPAGLKHVPYTEWPHPLLKDGGMYSVASPTAHWWYRRKGLSGWVSLAPQTPAINTCALLLSIITSFYIRPSCHLWINTIFFFPIHTHFYLLFPSPLKIWACSNSESLLLATKRIQQGNPLLMKRERNTRVSNFSWPSKFPLLPQTPGRVYGGSPC